MERVVTRQGTFRGAVKDGYTVFYGIPYAEAPVGERRFCTPVRALPFEGERDCTHPTVRPWMIDPKPESAVGKEFYFDKEYLLPFAENSLHLHIWTPAETPEERLPVAVWIHGGGFQKGYGTEIETDGGGFCKRDVILVSVEYRMGVLGFLCHPWLSAGQSGRCGNYGMFDQLEALKWVRDYIGAFGGDSRKITIIGQSAGAISVQLLASSPLTKGLFRGAVMQSGGGYQSPLSVGRSMRQAEELGEQFAAFAGVKSLAQLRLLPAEYLCGLAEKFQAQTTAPLLFAPVIDGYFLKDMPDRLIEENLHAEIPYLIGNNADDMCVQELEGAMSRFAQKNRALGKPPVYLYRFDRVPPADQEGMYPGAYHSAEIWYVFETCRRGNRPYREEDYILSEKMADCWCNFVKNGNPDPHGTLGWNSYSSQNNTPYRFFT